MPLRRARAENSFAAFDKGFNMRRSLVVVFVCLFFALAAHAGSIPTYTITQGSAVISINPFDLDPDIFFQFSGSGFSVTGSGGISSNFGIIGAPPGFGPLDPGLSIFSDFSNDAGGFGTIGGVNYSSLCFLIPFCSHRVLVSTCLQGISSASPFLLNSSEPPGFVFLTPRHYPVPLSQAISISTVKGRPPSITSTRTARGFSTRRRSLSLQFPSREHSCCWEAASQQCWEWFGVRGDPF